MYVAGRHDMLLTYSGLGKSSVADKIRLRKNFVLIQQVLASSGPNRGLDKCVEPRHPLGRTPY